MPTTYTSSLGLALPATGENSGTWGDLVNNSITSLLDTAVAGQSNVSMTADTDKTLTSTTGAANESRAMFLAITSTVSLTATRNIIVPTASKLYYVYNNTTGGQSLTIKTAAGTGITVATQQIVVLWCDGTNVINAINRLNGAATNLASGAAGQIPYQSASGTTGFSAAGTAGQSLLSGGTGAPTWGSPTIAANSVTPSMMANSGYEFGMHNRIINGAMNVRERPITSITGGGSLTSSIALVDRWIGQQSSGAGAGSVLSYSYVTGTAPFATAMNVAGGSNAAGVTLSVAQRIEAVNCSDLVNSTCSLQAQLSVGTATTITWTVYRAASTDSWQALGSTNITSGATSVATGTWSGTTTPTTFSASFNAGANAANGLMVVFSITGTAANSITITGVQLEKGATATPYEWRPINVELSMCQRYYYNRIANSTDAIAMAFANSGTTAGVIITHPVTLRNNSGTFSASAASQFSLQIGSGTFAGLSSISATTITKDMALIACGTSGMTTGQAGYLFFNTIGSIYAFNAEL